MSIVIVNKLCLDLVGKDFSDGHAPNNGGPTKTSRALAIIHLAARDAYAKVTSAYAPKLQDLPNKPGSLNDDDSSGQAAAIGAALRAAGILYPDFAAFIGQRSGMLTGGVDPTAMSYGAEIAEKWIATRQNDGSGFPQSDSIYNNEPGHHRADPVSNKSSLG